MGRPRKSIISTETDELQGLTPTEVKAKYRALKDKYDRLQNGYYCHNCGKHLDAKKFYLSTKTKSGVIPTCKECLTKIATGYNEKTKKTNESEDSLKKALKIADLPFIRSCYLSATETVSNIVNPTFRSSIWSQMIIMLQSLPQYAGMSWENSDPDVIGENIINIENKQKARMKSVKFFGSGFSDEDYIFLQEQYDDWTSRYETQTKAQEEVFKRLCFKQLEILKATRQGANTKDLDKTFQDLLATGNLQPKQNALDSLSDAQTFGTLIKKWEVTSPIDEVDEELKDIDNIGLYIDVFFRGHLSKVVDIKNRFSDLYEKYMKKYTATKPEYNEDTDSETIFSKVFGKEVDSGG